jgi:hypothetical protein
MMDGRGPGPGRGGMMPGGPPGFDFGRLEQDDPEMFKLVQQDQDLEGKTLDLAAKVRSAKADEREKLRADLAVTVDEHFNVRQARRELQLKRMEEELKRLRAAIESRNKGREEIVAKRLTELVGEEKDLEF